MTEQAIGQRFDRGAISNFASHYSTLLNEVCILETFPEDDHSIPPDSRIDAIYRCGRFALHIEHTSIDLVMSGKRNKRSLDPGFTAVEAVLSQVRCPEGQGVTVYLPLPAARDINQLKKIAPKLRQAVEEYLVETPEVEWNKYPRKPDNITIDGTEFLIRPDPLNGNTVSLVWIATDDDFVNDEKQLEHLFRDQINSKLTKLENSIQRESRPALSILLVETNDIAAPNFYNFAGTFARMMDQRTNPCSEIWTMHGSLKPTLIWCKELDLDRVNNVFTDDPAPRSVAEIESQRMRDWYRLRQWNGECSGRGGVIR